MEIFIANFFTDLYFKKHTVILFVKYLAIMVIVGGNYK